MLCHSSNSKPVCKSMIKNHFHREVRKWQEFMMNIVTRTRGVSAWMWTRRCANKASGSDSPLRKLLKESSTYGELQHDTDPELRWATEPYAVGTETRKDSPREAVDPRLSTVLLFPGQGSQHVGMGLALKDFPAARELYELASTVVGWDVWRVCTQGPARELEERCQTCVLVTSLAALERVREERPAALQRARAAAGFSLGELTALTFAGALPLESALRLVELRSAAMRAAAAERPQGMLTVWLAADATLPRALEAARDHAAERGVEAPVCQVANYMYPGCRVLAGDEAALAFVERRGREYGVRRSARVRVAGAFHTPLMARAAEAVRAAAAAVRPAAPRLRVLGGADARALRSGGAVAAALGRAVTAPVRWEQTLQALYARPRGTAFPLTLTLGPGSALRATLRQVNARAWDTSLQIDV